MAPPLSGRTFLALGEDAGVVYAAGLLRHLGATITHTVGAGAPLAGALADHPMAVPCPLATTEPEDEIGAWARSGAMWLTGEPDGPPLVAPGIPATAARGAALVVELLSACRGRRVRVDGPALLGERAALTGLCRAGAVSAGSACRLLSTRDSYIAVNLPRPADLELVPAWLETGADSWTAIAAVCRDRSAADLVERAALVGLAITAPPGPDPEPDAQLHARGQAGWPRPWLIAGGDPTSPPETPLVVDLSALWAGPLCGNLLQLAGCRVVKVEAKDRPDGARFGVPAFFSLLNGAKESADLGTLRELLDGADVVIEASRPRALEQLGIDPADYPGTVWVSVTGYGRSGPWRNRPSYGDDAAVAGGLVAGGPVFVADAIADPLGGLHAAVAALGGLVGRRAALVDMALREVAGCAAGRGLPARGEAVWDGGDWWIDGHRVARPTARGPDHDAAQPS